jgi:hypothetical protein
VDPIVFGDAESALLALLRDGVAGLPDASFGVVLPRGYKAEKHGEFMRIERIGGYGDGISHDAARVDIEVWGADRGRTHDILHQALACVLVVNHNPSSYGGQCFYGANVELGPSYRPDPVANTARWLSTVVIRTRPVRATNEENSNG